MSKNLRWKPLSEAVEAVAGRRGVMIDEAEAILLAAIAAGEIKARCRSKRRNAEQGQWIEVSRKLAPEWLGFVAYSCPQDNHLRFDLAAAARARKKDERVTPPEHARDIVVDAARLDDLWPPSAPWPSAPSIEVKSGDAPTENEPRVEQNAFPPLARMTERSPGQKRA